MRRALLAIVLVTAGILTAGYVTSSARAESMGWVTAHEEMIFFFDKLTVEQITELQIELGRALRTRAAEMPGWQCVGSGPSSGEPRVILAFDAAGRVVGLEGDQTYKIAMKLTVKGMGTRDGGILTLDMDDPEIQRVAESSDPVVALAMVGRAMLEDLMKSMTPCEVKTKLQGRSVMDTSGIRLAYTYQAESKLSLAPDGSFDATGPMSIDIEATLPASDCVTTLTGRVIEPSLRAVGTFRAADESLSFRELRVSAAAITAEGTVACPSGGSATCTLDSRRVVSLECSNGATASFPGQAGGDLLEGSGLTVALRGGESRPIPQPSTLPSGMTWDFSLGVEYGGAATGAGSAPRVAALPASPVN